MELSLKLPLTEGLPVPSFCGEDGARCQTVETEASTNPYGWSHVTRTKLPNLEGLFQTRKDMGSRYGLLIRLYVVILGGLIPSYLWLNIRGPRWRYKYDWVSPIWR